MKKEFLEDYAQKEYALQEQYKRWIIEENTPVNPLLKRLIKPIKPFARAGNVEYSKISLWAQIPFCGSLFLTLPPFEKDTFEKVYNLRASQIPDLVKFVKDTGKLQITLSTDPVFYEGLDYLDPIFKELMPIYEKGFPSEVFVEEKSQMRDANEYLSLGQVRYFDFLREIWGKSQESERMFQITKRLDVSTYTYLKVFKYDNLVEELQNLMVDKPFSALTLFYLCKALIVSPLTDPFCTIQSGSFDFFGKLEEKAKSFPSLEHAEMKRLENIQRPAEISQFLLTKLTHYPESFEASKELIAHYKTTDLVKIIGELNQGIVEKNSDLVKLSTSDLSQIMSELWNDKTINNRIAGLKFGIPVSIAIGGSMLLWSSLGLTGILAGLGVSAVTKILDVGRESISERIAKLSSKRYQATLYDFKKKYSLSDKQL